MTFAYKLSRRLARSRFVGRSFFMIAPILVFAACAQGELIAGLGPETPSVEDVTEVTLTPTKPSLGTDEMVRIKVRGHTDNGAELTPPMDWTSDGGTLTQTSNFEVYFSSTTTGSYKVVGRGRNKHQPVDTTVVVVTQPISPIASVTVTPDPASVSAGSLQTFVASGLRSDGTSASPAVTWTTTGGAISSGGVFVAGGTTGNFLVAANTTDGLTDAAAVSVTPATAAGQHEPSGYTRFAESSFAGSPNGCAGPGILDGCWWIYSPSGAPTIVALGDTGSALQFKFPVGQAPGSGNGRFGGWDTEGGSAVEYADFYEASWIEIPTPDFEMQKVGVKVLGYWGVGQKGTSGADNQIYGVVWGNGVDASLMSSWPVSICQQGQVSRCMAPNRDTSKKLLAGRRQQVETQMVLNTVGSANGILRLWIDGVLTHEYTDVVWRTSAYPSGFYGRRWDPIWGGTGGSSKSRNDYLLVHHIYMSGKRL